MVSDRINKTLTNKSKLHQVELKRLGKSAEDAPLSDNVTVLEHTPQVAALNTILLNPETLAEDFIFYFDRLATLMVER